MSDNLTAAFYRASMIDFRQRPTALPHLGWVTDVFTGSLGGEAIESTNQYQWYALSDRRQWPTARRLEDARTARSKLLELKILQDNWDGYGGSAISTEAMKNAVQFFDLIEGFPGALAIPEMSPTSSGTISFTWDAFGSDIYIEIGNTRFSGFVKSRSAAEPLLFEGHVDEIGPEFVSELQVAISDTAMPSLVTEVYPQAPVYELLAA